MITFERVTPVRRREGAQDVRRYYPKPDAAVEVGLA
jgi:hypothetical protein